MAGTALGELEDSLGICRERGFVAIPEACLDAAQLEHLMASLGSLMFTPGEYPLDGFEFVFEVTNRGRTRPPRSVFHSDTSYVARPPSWTALAAVEVPEAGGETLFVNQFDALSSAPASLVDKLLDVEFLHVASRVQSPEAAGHGQWHPVLRRHPDLERTALYVSARERLVGARRQGVILEEPEAIALVDATHEQACTGASVERHRWRSGDLLLTDNRSTLHAADHTAVSGIRTLHRVMVEGEVPIAGTASYGQAESVTQTAT